MQISDSLDLEKEKGKVARLSKNANEAKTTQQRVVTKLPEQTERTALAERTQLEVQEKVKTRMLPLDRETFLINLLKRVRARSVSPGCLWPEYKMIP